MPPNASGAPAADSTAVWKAYIGYARRLAESGSPEAVKVPAVLLSMSGEEIAELSPEGVRALQALKALPEKEPDLPPPDDVGAARAYVRLLRELKGDKKEWEKVPPVLRVLSEPEAAGLSSTQVQALRLMGVFPEDLFQPENPNLLGEALLEFCARDPELSKLVGDVLSDPDPKKTQAFLNNPKIQAFLASRPDLRRFSDRKMEAYVKAQVPSVFRAPAMEAPGPYRARPYESAFPANPSNPFMTPIGKEIGRLLGFP